MTRSAVVDAGPLVAFLDVRDGDHDWAVAEFGRIRPPLVTCEAAIVEATFVLRHLPQAVDAILGWIGEGQISIPFDLAAEHVAVRRLMTKYRDVPMSLADACLVRMAELFEDHAVCTLDGDFRLYRKRRNAAIPLIIPETR